MVHKSDVASHSGPDINYPYATETTEIPNTVSKENQHKDESDPKAKQ